MLKVLEVNGKKDYFLLLLSIILINGLAYIVGNLTRGSAMIYANLQKPAFAPPPWVFGVVWPILYFLMSIALYRILMLGKQGEDIRREIVAFTIQFILNLAWSIIFFYYGNIFLALIDLVILLIFIVVTIILFYRKDKIAGLLLIPYFLWCCFALVLNYSIYTLNKQPSSGLMNI